MSDKGIFISFEGGEGAGKTTVISEILRRLKLIDGEIVCTREPGGVTAAEQIRQVILANSIDAKTELLLYAAARNEHFLGKIQPALVKGLAVFCDRFIDSSIVYQGVVRGLGVTNVEQINDYFLGGLRPDLTFLLDVDPEISQARISQNRTDNNRFDLESIDFHRRVRSGFLEVAKGDARFVKIDASQSIGQIVEQILAIICQKFPGRFEVIAGGEARLSQQNPNLSKRIIYTDGSASPNPGPGGFAVIEGGRPIALGRENPSTNIRMEGLALKRALEILDGEAAEIWTDSELWVNVLTKWASGWQAKGWRKTGGEIKNLDIVKPLFELYQKSNVELKWLRGHAGQEQNELADQWANKAREGEEI